MNRLAVWLIVLVLGGSLFMLFIGNPLIDWLDEWSNRITPEEARRRARLSMTGQWPPPEPQYMVTPRWFAVAVIALALLGFLSWYLTR